MFDPAIYRARRERLKKDVGSGLILLLGTRRGRMNYAANTYHFRQDSTFLYFFSVDLPGLAALIDVDQGTENAVRRRSHGGRHRLDRTAADHRGPGQGCRGRSHRADGRAREASRGGDRTGPPGAFPQPYRAEHTMKLTALLASAGHGGVVPLGAAPQGRCCAAERQVGGGGGGEVEQASACRARCT